MNTRTKTFAIALLATLITAPVLADIDPPVDPPASSWTLHTTFVLRTPEGAAMTTDFLPMPSEAECLAVRTEHITHMRGLVRSLRGSFVVAPSRAPTKAKTVGALAIACVEQ